MATSDSDPTVDFEPEIKRLFKTLLESEHADRLEELSEADGGTLYIEAETLHEHSPSLLVDYRQSPDVVRTSIDVAIDELMAADSDDDRSLSSSDVTVRLTDTRDFLDPYRVSELGADMLDQFIAVEGQLSKVSEVTHRFTEICFECQRCPSRTYIPQPPTRYVEPHECQGCERQGPFTRDTEESTAVDRRVIELESPPGERARSMPDSVVGYAEEDLCWFGGENGLPDLAGQHVVVLGTYEVDENELKQGSVPATDGFLDVEAIVSVEEDYENITVEETKGTFEKLANGEEDPVELLKKSIAPSLYVTDELDTMLEAAVAYLFNGYRMEPPGGDDIRGDLHVGFIGDPATGKSTIMSNMARIAPKSLHRSGGSITEVGLTAAARQEEFAGESQWTLEPGILPSANGGHALIDEADALVEQKHTKAIHDALEGEQMVKVDKAGIRADLPSRTALCISGNPDRGRFDQYEPIAEQLDMDPALISRMDVLLPVTDEPDRDIDEKKAETALSSIRQAQEAEAERRDGDEEDVDEVERPVPSQVFRDWVYYARENVFPKLTDESEAMLQDVFLEARNLNGAYDTGEMDSPIPATTRVLGAGVRLSTAFARVDLSETIEPEHVERAERILKASIGMNFDREANAFDVDGKGHATPSSKLKREKLVHAIIETRIAEFDDGVPHDVIVEQAVEEGADRGKIEQVIESMKQQGELYEPQTGRYRST